MASYFYVVDAEWYGRQLVPALAASWRGRTLKPCRVLCRKLAPAARDFWQRYGGGEPLPVLCQVADGLAFDRNVWHLLVGEILLHAGELPLLQTAPDTLRRLVGASAEQDRTRYAPVDQAHFGSRDLVFGSAYYQSDKTGLNDRDDVARLADYLAAIDPGRWTPDDLTFLDSPEDREEELAFVREWFPALQHLYRQARQRGQVIICEVP